MDRGTWRATVHRVTKSWTQLKQLSTHAKYNKTTFFFPDHCNTAIITNANTHTHTHTHIPFLAKNVVPLAGNLQIILNYIVIRLVMPLLLCIGLDG